MKHKKIAFSIAITLALTTGATTHSGATGPTLVRMNAMSQVQTAVKQLKLALASPKSNGPQINEAFNKLRTFGEELPQLFKTEHMTSMSEASPTIWSEPDDFGIEIEVYNNQIEQAVEMIDSNPNAIMKVIAKSCQSCHTKFREK